MDVELATNQGFCQINILDHERFFYFIFLCFSPIEITSFFFLFFFPSGPIEITLEERDEIVCVTVRTSVNLLFRFKNPNWFCLFKVYVIP